MALDMPWHRISPLFQRAHTRGEREVQVKERKKKMHNNTPHPYRHTTHCSSEARQRQQAMKRGEQRVGTERCTKHMGTQGTLLVA